MRVLECVKWAVAGAVMAATTSLVWTGCGGATELGGGTGGSAGTASWAVCDGPGQCVALTTGCCPPCGKPTLASVTGVNRARQSEFRADTCTDVDPVCPKCATGTEPNLVAFCTSGRCTALDVRQSELSACTSNGDCMLREPDCCVSCQPQASNLIAIATAHAADYSAAICGPGQACAACAPIYPAGYAAECSVNGHCIVVYREHLCPVQQPGYGAACSNTGLTCEYGADLRPGCRTHATCTNGAWQIAIAGCKPLPGPGQAGCPSTFPVTGVCSSEGLVCDMGQGAVCACGSCVGGLCSTMPHWGCASAPSTPGCPGVAPAVGTTCSQAGLDCLYGLCGTPTSAGRRCTGGAWQDEAVACPA